MKVAIGLVLGILIGTVISHVQHSEWMQPREELIRKNEKLKIELATEKRHKDACLSELGDDIVNWEDIKEVEDELTNSRVTSP